MARFIFAKNFDQPALPKNIIQLSASRITKRTFSSAENKKFIAARNFLLENRTDYRKAYQEFKWPRMSSFNWALDYFDDMARSNHRTALWIVSEKGEVKRSFAQMHERSNQVANFLMANGVKPFDRIMLMLPNIVELWECMLAAIKIPAIIVPTATLLPPDDIRYRLETAKIQHIITIPSEAEKFRLVRRPDEQQGILIGEAQPEWKTYDESAKFSSAFSPIHQTLTTDPLLYYFTSGTTSKPKLVIHTHQSYPVGHLSTMYWLGLQANAIHLNIATPGWAKHPWSAFFAPWNAEACVFSYGYSRFDAERLLNILAQYPVSSLCAPPTAWRALRQKNFSQYRTHLKEMVSAGEPLNPEVISDFKKAWGLSIREGYGQTETTALIGYCPGQEQEIIPGTMGYPLPGYEVEVTQEGKLTINRRNDPVGLMQGYQEKDRTEKVMHHHSYETGDLVDRHSANPNILFFVAREDDAFKSSGYRISPFELESKLLEYPLIAEAAVVPSPHPIKENVPKAFVVIKNSMDSHADLAKEVFNFLRGKLADSHRIRLIEFVDELPKTASGKILRRQLAAQEKSNVQAGKKPPALAFHEADIISAPKTLSLN